MDVSKNVSFCHGLGAGKWWWSLMLLLGLAFLQPIHVYPLPNYLEGFGLGLGVVLLFGLMVVLEGRIYVNQFTCVWAGFGVVLAVSAVSAPPVFMSSLYLYFAFWVAGLAVSQISARLGVLGGADDLAWFLVVLSLLGAVGGLVRFYGVGGAWFSFYFPEPGDGRMVGLVGHSNYFAVLCFMGGLSLAWLASSRRIGFLLLLCVGAILSYCAVLAGSRVVFACFFVVLVFSIFVRRFRRFAFFLSLLGLVYLAVGQYALPLNFFLTDKVQSLGLMPWGGVVNSALERGVASDSRFDEWGVAWSILQEHWLWGVGAGRYAAVSYNTHLADDILPMEAIFTHSHNSYLQMVVEFGLLGLAWMSMAGYLVFMALRRGCAAEDGVRVGVLLTILVYSFFEFPLWLMHFFVLFMFVLGTLQQSREVPVRRVFGAPVVVFSVFFGVVYLGLFVDIVKGHLGMFKDRAVVEVDYSFANAMIRDPLLEPYGYLVYFANFEIDENMVDKELPVLAKFREFSPYEPVMGRYAICLAAAGYSDRSEVVSSELLRAFPNYAKYLKEDVLRVDVMYPGWDLGRLIHVREVDWPLSE